MNTTPAQSARQPSSIPRAKELPWVGGALAMARNSPEYLVRLARTYGPVVQFSIFNTPVYLISDAELAHSILVEQVDQFPKADRDVEILEKVLGTGLLINNGASHRQRRRLMQPAFHTKRIHAYAQIMVDYAQTRFDQWQAGQRVDMSEEMMKLTMFIVTKALFGTDPADMHDLVDEIEHAVRDLQESAQFDFTLGAAFPGWMPTPAKRKSQAARAIMDRLVNRIIHEYRDLPATELAARADLLAMLLLAQDDAGNQLDDAALRDEVITLFLAGHETTSNTLTWATYLLAQPAQASVLARLQQEVDAALAQGSLGLDTLPHLPYTLMVLKETMRFYPAAWTLNGRQATQDTQLGNYHIAQGSYILIAPYVLHRLAHYFPDPDRFDPSRFAPETEKELPRHAYIPFGAGPRICIGNSFAMLEAQLLLAAMVHRFRFEVPPGHVVEPLAEITLTPRGGLPLILHSR